MPIYDVHTKNFGFNTVEDKNLENTLRYFGKIKCIRSRGDDLTYEIETTMILPILIRERLKKIVGVEGLVKRREIKEY